MSGFAPRVVRLHTAAIEIAGVGKNSLAAANCGAVTRGARDCRSKNRECALTRRNSFS